jgi:N-acetylglucosamine-6-sulfatase
MQSPRFIPALQIIQTLHNQSGWGAWTKITAACKARRVTSLSCLGVILLGALVFSAPSGLVAQTATRPNIVVIMTDDQRLDDLQVMTKTKNLIGDAGTTFNTFFASFPLCCPSRVTFLTGQYAHNHGVLGNNPPRGGIGKLNQNNTLPLWLQTAGYVTSHIGTYVNGYTNSMGIPPGWNDWQGLPTGAPMYDYNLNDNGRIVHYGTAPQDYQTDVLANRAVATIRRLASNQQSFFLNIWVHAIHKEESVSGFPNPRPAPRHVGAFDNKALPRPPSFNEADVSDKPAGIRNLPLLTATDIKAITNRYRSRLATLLAVDDLVGAVVNKLDNVGELDSTVIIFTSDNGWLQGEHRIKEGKDVVYEESVRVPLLIRGGGFPQGATREQIVANIDLAPTIEGLANATPGRLQDGRSLLPLARDPSLAATRDILLETTGFNAVRNKKFVYVQYKSGAQELYDLRNGNPNYDPYQLRNRAADSAYAGDKSQLAATLSQLRSCSGEGCQRQ